jgi:hypothetical protein
MTLHDYGSFLRAVLRHGVGSNGRRIFSERTWQTLMTPTVNFGEFIGTLPVNLLANGFPLSRCVFEFWREDTFSDTRC